VWLRKKFTVYCEIHIKITNADGRMQNVLMLKLMVNLLTGFKWLMVYRKVILVYFNNYTIT